MDYLTHLGPIDQELAARQKATVLEMLQANQTPGTALELARQAMVWADHAISRLEWESPLPRPIVCQPGCHYCCINQVELTAPEALLLGHYVDLNFPDAEKARLLGRAIKSLRIRAGKTKPQIAQIRQKLRCPLLSREGRCSVYPLRPLVCRAMHSLDQEQCERDLKSKLLRKFEYYAHRYEIIISVLAGLMEGCKAMGLQSGPLDIARALRDFFSQERPVERWIQGEKVFT